MTKLTFIIAIHFISTFLNDIDRKIKEKQENREKNQHSKIYIWNNWIFNQNIWIFTRPIETKNKEWASKTGRDCLHDKIQGTHMTIRVYIEFREILMKFFVMIVINRILSITLPSILFFFTIKRIQFKCWTFNAKNTSMCNCIKTISNKKIYSPKQK